MEYWVSYAFYTPPQSPSPPFRVFLGAYWLFFLSLFAKLFLNTIRTHVINLGRNRAGNDYVAVPWNLLPRFRKSCESVSQQNQSSISIETDQNFKYKRTTTAGLEPAIFGSDQIEDQRGNHFARRPILYTDEIFEQVASDTSQKTTPTLQKHCHRRCPGDSLNSHIANLTILHLRLRNALRGIFLEC